MSKESDFKLLKENGYVMNDTTVRDEMIAKGVKGITNTFHHFIKRIDENNLGLSETWSISYYSDGINLFYEFAYNKSLEQGKGSLSITFKGWKCTDSFPLYLKSSEEKASKITYDGKK